MCRFIAYMGRPIILDELLFKPTNSLIRQSVRAREAEEPLNGDGFGLGWYDPEIDPTPALFVSIQPAWNDRNLMYLASKIRSNCFFAHVRAATAGWVSSLNCHPFHNDRFLMMHNGGIGGFEQIKRYLRRGLSNETYEWVKGQTDSEHMFAVFVDIFKKKKYNYRVQDFAAAFLATLAELKKQQKKLKVTEASYINVVITDGRSLLASRYISGDDVKYAPTLYYVPATSHRSHDGILDITSHESAKTEAVLIVSEKLDSHKANWLEIPVNHLLLVNDDLTTTLREIDI